jgi:glycosyltransferase involved in cell wall biosynthesis
MTASDISVVIPYFNREKYIDEAIQSVFAQRLPPLEVIIVNDASREFSRRYLDRYADACLIVDLATQTGAAAARNEGIRRARGRYIAFLDSDDVWLPEKLEVQRRYLEEHPECALVHSAAWSFASDRADFLCACDWPMPLTLAQALTHDHWMILPTVLVRANVVRALGGFDTKFVGSEDHDLTIRCCAAGYRIEGIREPLIRFRREGHPSLTRKRWRMFLTHLRLCWKHQRLYRRVYGIRGMASFLLATLHIAAFETHYVDGFVRFLMRIFKVTYRIRPSYRDPVASQASRIAFNEQGVSLVAKHNAQDSHA